MQHMNTITTPSTSSEFTRAAAPVALKTPNLEDFPHELLIEIFILLGQESIKNLGRPATTCKKFYCLLRDAYLPPAWRLFSAKPCLIELKKDKMVAMDVRDGIIALGKGSHGVLLYHMQSRKFKRLKTSRWGNTFVQIRGETIFYGGNKEFRITKSHRFGAWKTTTQLFSGNKVSPPNVFCAPDNEGDVTVAIKNQGAQNFTYINIYDANGTIKHTLNNLINPNKRCLGLVNHGGSISTSFYDGNHPYGLNRISNYDYQGNTQGRRFCWRMSKMTHNERYVVSMHTNGKIRVLDLKKNFNIAHTIEPQSDAKVVSIHIHQKFLICLTDKHSMMLYDVESFRLIRTIERCQHPYIEGVDIKINAMSCSQGMVALASSARKGSVEVWDLALGELIFWKKTPELPVHIKFRLENPVNNFLVLGFQEGNIQIWKI